MPSLEKFWQFEFLRNDLRSWAFALATFLITLTVLPILKRAIGARRRHWEEHAPAVGGAAHAHHALLLTALLVDRTSRICLWAVAVYLASRDLIFPARVERFLTIGIVLIFWTQVGV